CFFVFFFQAEDGIRDATVTGVQTCALPISHYIVARMLGVKVLRFSIGFGKVLYRHIGRSGTEFVLALIPLGGYVKMLDETEGERSEERRVGKECRSRWSMYC